LAFSSQHKVAVTPIMAESKRQAAGGGKVATPKLSPQAGVDIGSLEKAVGARIRVSTTLSNTTVEGTLFTICKVTKLLAIKDINSPPAPPTPSSAAPGNYHLIPFAHISSFETVAPASDGEVETAVPSISKVESDALKAREENAIREMKKWEAGRGKGVSKEAQEMFDHISRTLPTRWNDKQIIINDSVILDAPYSPSDLKAPKEKQYTVPQIKRVVEGYWSKKSSGKPQNTNNAKPQQNAGGNSRPGVATPIPPRKGG